MPSAKVNLGDEAVDFAAKAGLILDPWQQDVLKGSLGILPGGLWACRNVGLLVPRQNGKGAVLQARELFGMFVLGEPTIIHSAHKFDTSQEHFLRMRELIESNPDLDRHVKSMMTANGKESINLKNGCRLKFKARTISGSGRGFSGELLVLDEAMLLPEQAVAAMRPTLITRPKAQIWYTSSAGLPESTVLWRLVKQGRAGDTPRLGYWEWGAPSDADFSDRRVWADVNPGVGYRIQISDLEDEFRNMSEEDFAREFLGIWDDQANPSIFGDGVWENLENRSAELLGTPTFAVEVAEDRSWTAIAAAGAGSTGVTVDVVENDRGVDWVLPRLRELLDRNPSSKVILQPSSAAGSLIPDLPEVRVHKATATEYAQACGALFDLVTAGELAHLGQGELDMSVKGARKKLSADAWVWDRRKSGLDISPLVAVTLAAWGHKAHAPVDILASVW